MRTVGGGGNLAQPVGTLEDLTGNFKIQVANASDVLVDLSAFAVSLDYDQDTDAIVDAATIVFRRLEGISSLAPLMTASPPIALGRRVVVSLNPGSDIFTEIFRGKIDDVDWPERFGDVTVQCRDQAGIAADTQIETARAYGSTAGVSLETVMQAVDTDNLTTPVTLYFPSATSAVVQNLAGDPPYGPTEQSVLDALRALAESIGWTIRYRHFGASASDWRLTVFAPARTKTVADYTFTPSDYWDVTTMRQSVEDVRNVIAVEYIGPGETRHTVIVTDSASIAKYGRRYAKISEGSGRPVNTIVLATALANAALSDLKEPDAMVEITGRYFWPGEVGVDLYTFTANNKHFSTDQTLAAMRLSHRIAVGERPTTKILCRGKPSGGVLMWRRRQALGSLLPLVPELRVSNFREVARTETDVTFGWDVAGDVSEQWLYLSTPAQPIATDPWSVLTGVPTARLTGGTISYVVPIPAAGLVTYGRLVPVQASAARGMAWDFTVQGAAVSLIQRATIVSTSPTQIVVRVAVANPVTGGDVSVAYAAGGLTVTPASPQTIVAASITADLATTGTVDFTITRPAFKAGTGRVTFTASSTDRVADTDAVDVPAQEQDGTAQGTVAIASNGAWEATADGPPNALSFRWSYSTSSYPVDATVTSSGTLVSGTGRFLAITGGAALTLGQTVYVTVIPFDAVSGGGNALPSIHLRGSYQTFTATKTAYYGIGSVTEFTNPRVGFTLNSGAISLLSGTTIELGEIVVVPDGATITDVYGGVYNADPVGQPNSQWVYFDRVDGAGAATNLGSYDFSGGGSAWQTFHLSLSQLTTGYRFQFRALLICGTPSGNIRFGGFHIVYTIPSPVVSI